MSAFAKITPIEVGKNAFSTEAAFSGLTTALATNGATTATYGAYFEVKDIGNKYAILVQNAAASGDDKTVTIKHGNGFQSQKMDISKADLGYGEFTVISVDSALAAFTHDDAAMQTLSGVTSARGKIFITGTDANIKVAVIHLP